MWDLVTQVVDELVMYLAVVPTCAVQYKVFVGVERGDGQCPIVLAVESVDDHYAMFFRLLFDRVRRRMTREQGECDRRGWWYGYHQDMESIVSTAKNLSPIVGMLGNEGHLELVTREENGERIMREIFPGKDIARRDEGEMYIRLYFSSISL